MDAVRSATALDAQRPLSGCMTFDELRAEVMAVKTSDRPSYQKKMLHDVRGKDAVKDRNVWICAAAAEKVVLDVGASGQLHQDLLGVCPKVYGLDLHPDSPDIDTCDFDDPSAPLPKHDDVELVICGEILEHLSNPGFLLQRLRAAYPSQPLIVSVPNAFSQAAAYHIKRGFENVNRDHVAWYSPKTLEWLLARYNYKVKNWAWYNGQPLTAEGIIAVAE